jgi:hypothetical protein
MDRILSPAFTNTSPHPTALVCEGYVGKFKKGKGSVDDDSDDIIAQAEQLNTAITASCSSAITKNADNVKSSSSSKRSTFTEEEIIQLCKRGDLPQLKRCIKRGAQIISAGLMCAAAICGNTLIVRYLIEEHGTDVNKALMSTRQRTHRCSPQLRKSTWPRWWNA